jgi:triphosphatase
MDMTSPRLDAGTEAQTELELKLTCDPARLSKLLKSLTKAGGVDLKNRKTARVVSTYYDTEDRRLRRRGLTLRIRKKSGKLEQTIKSTGVSVSGILAREEWTVPVTSKTPDLSAVQSADVRGRMGLILPQELTPVFTTDIKRTTLLVEHAVSPGNSATVELAFDQGKVNAGQKSRPISELELELVSGTMSAMLDLAVTLSRQTKMVLTQTSKVEGGFELADGTYPRATMASKIPLTRAASIEDAMVKVFSASLGQLLANRAAAACGTDIEGVHQARIAIRRMKSAFSVFKKFLVCPEVPSIKAELTWLMDILGPARDLDVFLDEVLPAVMADRPDDPDLAALANVAAKAHSAAYRKVRSALNSARYSALALTMASWIEHRAWRDHVAQDALDAPLVELAGPLLTKRQRHVMKRGKGFRKLTAAERHQVRIALKKHRYAMEFFSGLYPDSHTRPFIAAMRILQHALGAANDVATAEHLTAFLIDRAEAGGKDTDKVRSGAGKVLGWHTHAAAEAERGIVSLWTHYAESRPFWHSA